MKKPQGPGANGSAYQLVLNTIHTSRLSGFVHGDINVAIFQGLNQPLQSAAGKKCVTKFIHARKTLIIPTVHPAMFGQGAELLFCCETANSIV
jgi:hypothetical protein